MARTTPTRRLLYWIGGLVLLVAAGLGIAAATGLLGNRDEAAEVETAAADVRRLTQVVTASGKVQPEIEVKISPDVSGEIIELRVREGDEVRQGDLLARIKPDFYTAQVEQAQAGVLQAQANHAQRRADLLKAEVDFRRQKDLFDRKVISESDFQAAQTGLEIARAGADAAAYAVQSAQARLREAREQLGKTNIYAPMTGTISQLNVELGERVVGTAQYAGTEMMRVAKLDRMELEVDVNENDVVNVSVGDTASIEIDAYPERKFKGIITEIANSARITGAGSQEQVTNFPVKVRILDAHNVEVGGAVGSPVAALRREVPAAPGAADAVLRPGMTGTVDVFTETVERAVAIPIQAVTVRDFNRLHPSDAEKKPAPEEEETPGQPKKKPDNEDLRKVVFVAVDGKARMVQVETGISDDTHIHIKAGLKGGEQVITGPYRAVSRELEPDAPIRLKTDEAAGKSPVVATVN